MRQTRRCVAVFLLAVGLLGSGCMQWFVRGDARRSRPMAPYESTRASFGFATVPWHSRGPYSPESLGPGEVAARLPANAVVTAVFAVDGALSLVGDTVMLPFDCRALARHQADLEFWNAYLSADRPLPTAEEMRKHDSEVGREFLRTSLDAIGRKAREAWPEQADDAADPGSRRRWTERLERLVDEDMCLPEVAGCPGLSPELVQRLASKANAAPVRLRLLANPALSPGLLEDFAQTADGADLRALARNPALPADRFDRLAREADPLVRTCLAGNPGLPARLMVCFAESEEGELRAALARNPRLPDELVLRLARDPAAAKALLAEGRDDLSPELLRQIGAICQARSRESYVAFLRGLPRQRHLPPDLAREMWRRRGLQSHEFFLLANPSTENCDAIADALMEGYFSRMAAEWLVPRVSPAKLQPLRAWAQQQIVRYENGTRWGYDPGDCRAVQRIIDRRVRELGKS